MYITEAQGFDSALLGCGDLAILPVSFFSSKASLAKHRKVA